MTEKNHQVLDVDVLFVGAGSASLASALHLKKLAVNAGMDISIAIIEKAREIGAHSLSGAIIDPRSLNELIPDHIEKNVPFESKVIEENMYYLHSKGKFRFPYLPKSMSHHGCYVASLGRFTRWLGKICEDEEIDIFWTGVEHLQVAMIGLEIVTGDDPQLIFETLNSTGLELSKADLVRNFLLMGIPDRDEQKRLWETYWRPMDQIIDGITRENPFDNYMKDFLTVKRTTIPYFDNIYEEFKEYYSEENEDNEVCLKELNKYVLDFCIPNIMTNIKQYIGYIKDVNAPRAVMENPIDTTTRANQLEYNMGFVNFN